jgi:hypothetical protein
MQTLEGSTTGNGKSSNFLSQSTGKSTVRRINVVETTNTTISQWPFHVEVVIGQSKNFLEAAYFQKYNLNGSCL